MRPFLIFHCFFVFLCAGVDRAACFSYVYCFLTTATLELIYAFAFARRWTSLIFCTEYVLELLATFVVEIAARF